MPDLTPEEYKNLDERLTHTTPKLGPNGTGFFSRKGTQTVTLDETTARILNARALALHQTPSEIINSLFRKELVYTHASVG